ncbi:MAG TPA: nickel-dependent lactate racemase [Tissierellaceae bacterium]|nr:nickel-dependent lactate racemase [Tissierellaceae bacterium]
MRNIELPYYTGVVKLEIEEKNLKGILKNNAGEFKAELSQEELVIESLNNPIGSESLIKLSKGKDRVLVVTSDHTRGVPSKITLPLILAEIRKGNPDADITIIISTGLHRATTEEEQRKMFGDEIVDNEKILVHDAFDDEQMEYVCQLPSGASFVINKIALESDLIVCEGFIEPHFFAGFSGGRKSILPGICSAETVNENHSSKAIAHGNSKSGIIHGNIIHEDMIFASRKIGVDFILNVALNSEKEIIGSFAGDLVEAHEKGCEFVTNLSKVPAITGDIVITSNGGYPLDQNLYQCPKAASTAEVCAGDSGVIILVASCIDGIGGTHFEEIMLSGTADEIFENLMSIAPKETIPEQWSAQIFSQIMLKHEIILVTENLDADLIKKLNMIPASNPQEALEIAYSIKGKDASVVVIPDGVAVIAVK